MANIDLIKELRKKTFAGVCDCKKALELNNFDIDKACDWLRKQGIIKGIKKADKIANEGLINVRINGNVAVIFEINCETDFVANSIKFNELIEKAANKLILEKPTNLDEAKKKLVPLLADAVIAVGEKVVLNHFELITKKDEESFGSYIHMKGKSAALVVINNDKKQIADDLATHIVANSPIYLKLEDIPNKVFESEKKIILELAQKNNEFVGKQQSIIDKIVQGKIKKNLSEITLYEQLYLLDNSKKVSQFLSENNVSVLKFVRYKIGEK